MKEDRDFESLGPLFAFFKVTGVVRRAAILTAQMVVVSHPVVAQCLLTEAAVFSALEVLLVLRSHLDRLDRFDQRHQHLLNLFHLKDELLDCVFPTINDWLKDPRRI